jgi:hypothetical protein
MLFDLRLTDNQLLALLAGGRNLETSQAREYP